MSNALNITVLAVSLFLLGCSAQNLNSSRSPGLKLLPPSEGPVPVLLKQRITLQTVKRQQQFLVVARYEQYRLKLVVLLPTGQVLLSLDYDGEKLTQESLSSIDLPGKDILASMQFAMWPEDSIKSHYPNKEGWSVKIAPEKRTLLIDNGNFLEINYQNKQVIVENHFQGYQVIVYTLERKEL